MLIPPILTVAECIPRSCNHIINRVYLFLLCLRDHFREIKIRIRARLLRILRHEKVECAFRMDLKGFDNVFGEISPTIASLGLEALNKINKIIDEIPWKVNFELLLQQQPLEIPREGCLGQLVKKGAYPSPNDNVDLLHRQCWSNFIKFLQRDFQESITIFFEIFLSLLLIDFWELAGNVLEQVVEMSVLTLDSLLHCFLDEVLH